MERSLVVGIVGLGFVGGTLSRWFEEHTTHKIRKVDPALGHNDSLQGCDAVFVCIPVKAHGTGQDLTDLKSVVEETKKYTSNVFIRSTVLPGTNDKLGTISMPEFFTARTAYEDMCKLPILCGSRIPYVGGFTGLLCKLFPIKELRFVTNTEAELAKIAHNCAGALKVTYWNLIYQLAYKFGADFERVKQGAFITGFIEPTHTEVPGPDGKHGYGGACFPENMAALENWLWEHGSHQEFMFINKAIALNAQYRGHE